MEEVVVGDDIILKVRGYTGSVFFTETTNAKKNFSCLEETMERLSRISAILQRLGRLGRSNPRCSARGPERPPPHPTPTFHRGAAWSAPWSPGAPNYPV